MIQDKIYTPEIYPRYEINGRTFIDCCMKNDKNIFIEFYNPCLEIQRFEDKIIMRIIIDTSIIGKLEDNYITCNIKTASEEYNNVPAKLYRNYRKGQWFSKVNPKALFEEPDFLYSEIVIDTNSDLYFNREILDETINMELTFKADCELMKAQTSYNKALAPKVERLTNQINASKLNASFRFSNTMLFQNEMKIPSVQRFTDGKLYQEFYYGLNASIAPRNDSFVRDIFQFLPMKSADVIIRGYDLELKPSGSSQLIKIKNRITKGVSNAINITEGYDFNPITNEFEETQKFSGINYPYQDDIDMKANVYIKVGNTNMKIVINKIIKQTPIDLTNLSFELGEQIDDKEYKSL